MPYDLASLHGLKTNSVRDVLGRGRKDASGGRQGTRPNKSRDRGRLPAIIFAEFY